MHFTASSKSVDRGATLEQIIKTLETTPNDTPEKPYFDARSFEKRFYESIYYLSTYGTTRALLRYLVAHNKLQMVTPFLWKL